MVCLILAYYLDQPEFRIRGIPSKAVCFQATKPQKGIPMESVVELFCAVDDFCQRFEPVWQQQLLGSGVRQRQRAGQMYLSEMMTIVIGFHQSHYREFKAYYLDYVRQHLRREFPTLLSYSRFVYLMPQLVVPLGQYLISRLAPTRGIAFIDSTPLAVCDNRRIERHRVFRGVAQRGKTSMGWFYGFKLHLVVNDRGELVSFTLTPGNVDDRRPVPRLVQQVWGKLFGDKGYLSAPLAAQLFEQGLELITHARRNMAARLHSETDRLLLRKRAIIETIADQLKNISQVEHTRHRSPVNFMVNVFAGLLAYTFQPKKPSLHLHQVVLPKPVLA
jgi:hypothetical protein